MTVSPTARLIWHPSTFPLLRRLMGDTMRLIHMSAMSRDAVPDEPHPDMAGFHYQMWHREQGGGFAPAHPYCMKTGMVLFCELVLFLFPMVLL